MIEQQIPFLETSHEGGPQRENAASSLPHRSPGIPAALELRQLDLFESHAARFAQVEEALREGRFSSAAVLARSVGQRHGLAEAIGLAKELERLDICLEQVANDPEKMVALFEKPDSLIRSRLTAALKAALLCGLHRSVAEAAERGGLVAVLERPVGWYWLRAEKTDKAMAALEAAVLHKTVVGESLSILGNLAFGEKAIGKARDLYRRAFCEDPSGVMVQTIIDSEVQGVLDDAEDLGLEPVKEWVPMVGYAAGLFRLPDEPQGRGACREFHAALLAGRRTGDVRHRRRMKDLASLLFEWLRDAKKL